MSNYRPISILSNFAKVMEQLIYIRIHYNVKPYISVHCMDLWPKGQLKQTLLFITQELSMALDNKSQVAVIYKDFPELLTALIIKSSY